MNHELESLHKLLDAHVVGHDETKHVLLLGLLCREHVYLEGPPGSAKTRMAEIVAKGSSLEFFFYQLHRDTRLAELVGDVVVERRPLPPGEGEGERIHQRIEPGGILTAEVCVLDDISRAPGEALNVLLRILNERKFGDRSIPLLTAIATSNPMRDEYYNEPLDPANLDRFADGTVVERPEPQPVADRSCFETLYSALARVEVPTAVKDALIQVLRALVVEHDCNETNSLLTDRSFLVKAVKLLRGQALLAGRQRVALADLEILRWMTTFRVPEEVHEKVPEVIGLSTSVGS
jgi:MoxR-like ATPase